MSKELTPLKTFELLCHYCVEEINILRHRQIVEDYFYNEKYEVSITDKKTLEKGFTANIEKALKALEIIKELFDFDFAIRFGSNQLMLRITNKRTNEYWEIPISKEEFDLLKEMLL